MLIDETHKKWLVRTVVLTAAAAVGYVPYHLFSPNGAQGGSAVGLVYGSVGYGLMLVAGALGLRKRFPTLRVGRVQLWMRAHLWLGTLSLPLIIFHSGFSMGGAFTSVLMVLSVLVVLSGVYGAVLQHYLPKLMTLQVPMETVYEEITSIRRQLSDEADWIIASQEAQTAHAPEPEPAVVVDPSLPKTFQLAAKMDAMAKLDKSQTVFMMRPTPQAVESLRSFYTKEVEPFLERPRGQNHQLGVPERAKQRFDQLRTLVPTSLHDAVNDLENICEEARQLNRQEKLHHWLHGWLLFHIPLSYTLLLLGAIHAVVALRY